MDIQKFYNIWLKAKESGQPLTLIDVRSASEFNSGHVPGARLITLQTIPLKTAEIDASTTVYMICQMGGRSAQAMDFLVRQAGFHDVVNIDGGTQAWRQQGYPLEV
ncbi:MAG: rhodanese-like domain-containing protein [Zetaproteobacteria bacterium]|nr:rhodanese-like domain-containing protein [Zetaproteobacteria bacterium]